MPQDPIDNRHAKPRPPAEGAPRPLEDEQLETVAGGGTYTVTFGCCGNSYVVSAGTQREAGGMAQDLHDSDQGHFGQEHTVT